MYADSAHAPFYYGVCSGDPAEDGVVLWTHLSPSSPDSTALWLLWEVASDSGFANIVQSGSGYAQSGEFFSYRVWAGGLAPGAVYYYRFTDAQGQHSDWGRAKTLPTGHVQQTKIGVLSCSSVYSGFFNAYRRLAERSDLQLVVHLGDYIYDFVDADEQVRVPTPYPAVPQNAEEWAERHRYYLLDPDLRQARRLQTWVALWDNHDMDHPGDTAARRVFRQWLPIRSTPQTEQDLLYRSFAIGDLVDLAICDIQTLRSQDSFPGGQANLLGQVQFDWLSQHLKTSTARWRLLGNQKMAGGWYTTGIDPGLLSLVPNDGPVFDANSWDGFMETRERLLDTVAHYNINNMLIISGDAHITMAMDLVKHPHDSTEYDPQTGAGSRGAEFLPTSISRGNFDESGLPTFLSSTIIGISMGANPHHQHTEINSHGYGIVEIGMDSLTATPYYSEILAPTNQETVGQKMVMMQGDNHWKRYPNTAVATLQSNALRLYPNPADGQLYVEWERLPEQALQGALFDAQGRRVAHFTMNQALQALDTAHLPAGLYFFVLFHKGSMMTTQRIVIEHR